jgi:LacI family transcriptional regulator
MESLTKWLISLPKPVAMMTCNDDRGLDVLRACHIANLHVPELVSIVGADNDLITCNMYTPALSSIQFNLEHAGYIAAAQLDHMLRGKKPQVKEILIKPVDVVERQSSNSMAVQDKTVLSAVDFIRLNSAKNLSVENVAQAVSVSRRSLERKFKTILGRSVLEEIQNVRSHKIAQMLTETRLSIMQISLAMGFNGIENISRYFKQTYGMRPSTYRKTLGLPSRSAF